ncbi:hypothetical protein C0580_03470 [Candidatus Parcubacteria bacterium]|nr:MAG: hypothetical protein C0580_03470 [Candidatus Parcubacteria bacterium]
MKKNKNFYWTPRFLGTLFLLFVVLINLKVLDAPILANAPLMTGFLPSFVLLFILLVSWRWEVAGGIFYMVIGAVYMIVSWGNVNPIVHLLVSGLALVTGILFVAKNLYTQKGHK